VRLASLFWLLFSTGGVLLVVLVITLWLIVRPRSRAPRICLAFAVAAYTVMSIYPIPHAVSGWWSRGFVPLTKDAVPAGRVLVVILGSGSYTAVDWAGGRAAVPDPIGLERTAEAARLYHLIDPAWIVSSGGLSDPRAMSSPPGQTMAEILVRLGVPRARIIVKDQARDTHDESERVKALLPALHVDHVVVVTSAVHMLRAVAVFRAAGIEVIPAPARENRPWTLEWSARYLPSDAGMYEASLTAHEILGYAYYRMRGWR
jgi:uncharacterized SAM-binding protein YcdF (DUF218 family)